MLYQILPSLRILLQVGIPECERLKLRALQDLYAMTSIANKPGESHVRSTLEFHLVFVARRGHFRESLATPGRRFAKWAEVARTVHQQHRYSNFIPRVLAEPHNAFSLRRQQHNAGNPLVRKTLRRSLSRQQNRGAADETSRISA